MEPAYIVMAIIIWLMVGASGGWLFWRREFGQLDVIGALLLPLFAFVGPLCLIVLWRQKRYER